MKNRFIIILFSISTFFVFNAIKSVHGQYYDNAQAVGFFGNFSINANIGTALPFADVSQDFKPYQDDYKMAWGFKLRKQLSPIFGIGGEFITGKLHGTRITWDTGADANLYFDSEFMEFNFHAIMNLSNLLFGYQEERTVHLYSTIGLGFTNWATIQRDLNTNAETATSGFDANGAKAWTPELSIPVGMGMYFALGKKWGFNLEASVHRLNSDDLDAYVSGSSKQDYYTYISAGLSFNLSGVSNAFRKAGKNETNFDKETRKLEKYQERQAKKNRREEQRDDMERERKTNIEKAKRTRRDPSEGMPKVVEYDAVYSHDAIKKISEEGKSIFGDASETEIKGEREIVFDEGKHFITGAQGPAGQPTGSANIITSKDALKLKSNSYQQLTITDGTGTTTTVISGDATIIPETGKVYTVQILASRTPAKNLNTYRERYGINQIIYYSFLHGMYRYSAGIFANYYDAQSYANTLKRNGLTDAFVATYNNGIRVIK